MSTGQLIGTAAGTAYGFLVGGPAGAVYGAQIGYAAGTILDAPKGPTVEGPRLGDLSVQTSTYGQFIPRTYGTIGLSGNVFWLENNKIKEVVKKKKSGGKGGGSSTTVKTYTYFATFAVGLCEGPIAGVRRIWVGPDLVYDAGSDDLDTIIASNQSSSRFTIYLGNDTQQPDPRMQAEIGASNCPAFRGLAYIVVKDLALSDYGNSVSGAQVKVEIVNSVNTTDSRLLINSLLDTGAYPGNDSGSISNIDGDGALFAVHESGNLIYTPVSMYGEKKPSFSITDSFAFGPYDFQGSFISDKLNFVSIYSDGSNINLLTIDGVYFPGAVSGVSGEFINDNDRYFYFQTDSTIAKQFGKSLGELRSGTINASRNHCISGDYIYGFSSDYSVLYKWDIYDFSLLSTLTLGTAWKAGYSPKKITYTDGIYIYLVSDYGVYLKERFLSVNLTTGDTFISPEFGDSASGYDGALRVSGNLIYRLLFGPLSGPGAGTVKYQVSQIFSNSDQSVLLSDIFESESIKSVLIKNTDIDSSGLTDSVTGFKVTATGSIRNAIEPLRGAWPFDVVQSGYKIKATTRGAASVVTIPVGELAIDTQLSESREMDSQLPQNVTVKYIDRDRDYDVNEQRAQRDNTEAVNSLVIDLPVVLSATQSAQVAEKLIRIYALEKSDFSFTLPAPYRYLEAGDVVTIATDDADYALRLVSVNYTAGGRLECAGRPSSASTYTSIAPGDGGQQGDATIPLAGSTIGIIIDCPVIDEGLQNAPGFASAFTGYSTGWPGGVLYQTADGGQTWTDLQAFDGKSTAGYAQAPLVVNAGNLIQKGGSLTVSLISGTLESVTEAQMLNGANIAAYGIDGRWEIIRFQNATLNGDGTYTLDTFWRGDRGTEWATGLHASNDYFILMTDPDLAFVGMPTDSIGQPRDYRAITVGADIDSAISTAYTYEAVNLETYSGVHPVGSRMANDLTIKWQRRTRVGGAWRDNVDASLGETSEAYEVDIMDGATVKRTLTASTPSVLYTSAMQITDFGSNQPSVTVKIYQLSSVVGRGYPLEATL